MAHRVTFPAPIPAAVPTIICWKNIGTSRTSEAPAGASLVRLVPMFFQQMIVGTAAGIGAGKVTRWAINRIKLEFEGLYPVLSVALVVLTYGATQSIGGSGFLAVYISGIVLGNQTYVNKRSLTVFHDGLAW